MPVHQTICLAIRVSATGSTAESAEHRPVPHLDRGHSDGEVGAFSVEDPVDAAPLVAIPTLMNCGTPARGAVRYLGLRL